MGAGIHITGGRTTKIYCRPGCTPGRRTRPENRVYFTSPEEARAAGFRPCKVCRPDDPSIEILYLAEYESPIGPYRLASSRRGVVAIDSDIHRAIHIDRWRKAGAAVVYGEGPNRLLRQELDAYFAGKLHAFTVPLDLRGTPFQRRVWDVLLTVPWGQTLSYGQVAARLGRPKAARAVGRAVGTNPVAIVVPCHRVLGSDGLLTGYGGGLETKKALLRLEGIAYRE